MFLRSLFFLYIGVAFISKSEAQKKPMLQAGPLNGYAEMLEAVVWVQTSDAANVFIEYWKQNAKDSIFRSTAVNTSKHSAFTAKLVANQVEPGTRYEYRVVVNNKKVALPYTCTFQTQTDWPFKTDPPAFTMLLGSCTYINETRSDRPGTPYGAEYQIFEKMADLKPDIMFWLGDNIYLRPMDWTSRTGYLHRYSHTRKEPRLQRLMATGQHFAIWDDHDFGPNDARGSYVNAGFAHEAFRLFWPNPTLMTFNQEQSTATAFSFNGIDFFGLDNRSFRTVDLADTAQRQIFGKPQLDWLIENLKFSQAPFKIVALGGQLLNPAAKAENVANCPTERAYLLKRIEEEKIKGVIFVSGDRHHSEVNVLKNQNGHTIWEITSSPLTAGPTKAVEENPLRLGGSLIQGKRNFAKLQFNGSQKNRTLLLSFHDSEGLTLFECEIKSE